MNTHDVILLLAELTGQRIVVNINETQVPPFDTCHIPTDQVHFKLAPQETTNILLDALTVLPDFPASNRIQISPGNLQCFDELVTVTSALRSEPLTMIGSGTETRRDIVCIKKNRNTQFPEIVIVEGVRGSSELPLIPFDCFPLAVVTITPGKSVIENIDIWNFRTLYRYTPNGKYRLPPVQTAVDLDLIKDPVIGMDALVIEEGCYYFYDGGKWRKSIGVKFENTVFIYDANSNIEGVDLPWPLRSTAEIIVFRDGMLMAPGKDYTVRLGLAARILFNYTIYKDQRIVVIRNPFLGMAHDPSSNDNEFDIWHIYVDGIDGRDFQSGTSYADAFQTLKRAFEVIPPFSKDMYIIHARNLRKIHAFTNLDTGKLIYGILRNKTLTGISVDIESAEVDIDIPHVFTMVDVRSVYLTATTYKYATYFIRCSLTILNSTIKEDMYCASCVVFVRDSTFEKTFALFAGSTALSTLTNFNVCNIHSGGYLEGKFLYFSNLLCSSGGFYLLDTATVHGAYVVGGHLTFDASTFYGAGKYSQCYILLRKCSNKGIPQVPVEGHFQLFDGAVMVADDCIFQYLNTSAIRAKFGAKVHAINTLISDISGNGIEGMYNCSIETDTGTRITKCLYSGIFFNFGSHGIIKDTVGDHNLRYGGEAINFSYFYHETSSLTGDMGQWYFYNPGADTVAVSPVDRFPGTLSQKMVEGNHVQFEQVEIAPNNYVLKVGLDYNSVYIAPKAMVYSRTIPLLPGEVWTVDNKSPNPGLITEILAFKPSNIPGSRVKNLTSVYQDEFNQMDKTFGTVFTAGDLRLKFRAGIGYPDDTPYWVYSYRDGGASLATHSLAQLTGFQLDYTLPLGTYIKVGFSYDNSNTFRYYNLASNSWIPCGGGTVLGQLMQAYPADDVNLYPAQAWDALRAQADGQPIQVGILLGTSDHGVTPTISRWTWTFVQAGYRYPVKDSDIEVKMFNNGIEITNTSGQQLEPPIHAVFLPLTNNM